MRLNELGGRKPAGGLAAVGRGLDVKGANLRAVLSKLSFDDQKTFKKLRDGFFDGNLSDVIEVLTPLARKSPAVDKALKEVKKAQTALNKSGLGRIL